MPARINHPLIRISIRFLGSMNLAITLLVAIAIAAIIGTVLQQNQPYPDYLLKFGPFWFEIFKALDLFDVYSSSWFLTILAFLVISTSICLYRNMPRMLQDIQDYRENTRYESLKSLPHSRHWHNQKTENDNLNIAQAILRHKHYKSLVSTHKNGILLAAKKGSGSRLGYIFTHLAIVIICIGGLLDGNLPLKIAELRGQLQPETRRIPASEVPNISTLSPDNLSFRANIDIAEGQKANLAFIDYKDGYLVQKLPFDIGIKDFRIQHYASGQPKSFETDLLIFDPALKEPIKHTISVNHPFSYQGYTIYQNSFGDGGSQLSINLLPLSGIKTQATAMKATVKQAQTFVTDTGPMTLEISDFRPFNVNPDPSGEKKFRNIGPSFQFKLRQQTGIANEYINYMLPIQDKGAYYYLTGMRSSPAKSFQYWLIPADQKKSPNRFINFLALLRNTKKLEKIALNTAKSTEAGKNQRLEDQQNVADFMVKLSQLFIQQGFPGITRYIEQTVCNEQQPDASKVYSTVLQHFLGKIYLSVLADEGINQLPMTEFDQLFFNNAVTAASVAYHYQSPVLIQLDSFTHIEASGLQITRSPGTWLVFPGCLLLVIGTFCMFYLPQRRLWLLIRTTSGQTELQFAGSAQRNRYDFDKEFELLTQQLTLELS